MNANYRGTTHFAIYMYTKFLCCTPKSNTMLYINHVYKTGEGEGNK